MTVRTTARILVNHLGATKLTDFAWATAGMVRGKTNVFQNAAVAASIPSVIRPMELARVSPPCGGQCAIKRALTTARTRLALILVSVI